MGIQIHDYTPRLIPSKEFKVCTGTSWQRFCIFFSIVDKQSDENCFLLERNEKLNKLTILALNRGLSFLDFFYLVHERRICSDLFICLVCLKLVDATRSFHLLTKVNVTQRWNKVSAADSLEIGFVGCLLPRDNSKNLIHSNFLLLPSLFYIGLNRSLLGHPLVVLLFLVKI